MLRRTLFICLLLLAACQPEMVDTPPTLIPFPTMTPGWVLSGGLPTVLPANSAGLSNPATAVARANLPTATPDYGACPPTGPAELPAQPENQEAIVDAMVSFLNTGGEIVTLVEGIRNEWNLLTGDGIARADDLTGEGIPEILVTFSTVDAGGTLLILGCANGRYHIRYEAVQGTETPRLIQLGDMNFDNRPDLLFSVRGCEIGGENCQNTTQLLTWNSQGGRFVNLLDRDVISDGLPNVSDVDNDRVSEIVIQQDNPGTAETGPLRTGSVIYDWNGAAYVRSITRLDPPRYRIQIIQEADAAADRLEMDRALSLYEFALNAPDLQGWLPDEAQFLPAYVQYRTLLAKAYLESPDLLESYQLILDTYPDTSTAPVYVLLSTAFWNALQVTNNLNSACLEVKQLAADLPDSVNLLNRYGSRSPAYNADLLCPF